MKCPNCKNFVMDKADKCSCGHVIVKSVQNDLCDKCKHRRGRKIITQKGSEYRQEKSVSICFECHIKSNEQEPAKYKTQEEKRFAEEMYRYSRALYYGDKPDEKALSKAAWEKDKAIYEKPIPEIIEKEPDTQEKRTIQKEQEREIFILDDEETEELYNV